MIVWKQNRGSKRERGKKQFTHIECRAKEQQITLKNTKQITRTEQRKVTQIRVPTTGLL